MKNKYYYVADCQNIAASVLPSDKQLSDADKTKAEKQGWSNFEGPFDTRGKAVDVADARNEKFEQHFSDHPEEFLSALLGHAFAGAAAGAHVH